MDLNLVLRKFLKEIQVLKVEVAVFFCKEINHMMQYIVSICYIFLD